MESTKINFSENDIYVNSDNQECIITDNLMNMSWAENVEEELGSSIENKILNNSTVINEKEADIQPDKIEYSDIKKLNINTLTHIDILQYQSYILNNLKKNNKNIEKQELSEQLKWVYDSSKIIADYLKQDIVIHKTDNKTIPRSSYKFCNYNFECEFNYNKKKFDGCFAQHYVFGAVCADIDILCKHLENDEIINDEVQKSINTISFVINHMYDELKNTNLINCIERKPKHKRKKN